MTNKRKKSIKEKEVKRANNKIKMKRKKKKQKKQSKRNKRLKIKRRKNKIALPNKNLDTH